MATLGNAKYDLSIKYAVGGTTTTKTKSISSVNYNGTGAGGGSTALGGDVDAMYQFATLINTSIIGGTAPEITLNEGRQITNG